MTRFKKYSVCFELSSRARVNSGQGCKNLKMKYSTIFSVWDKSVCSYLTPFFLPENCWLGISFGFTWEGGGTALWNNLIPRTDDKLGWSWSQRTKGAVSKGDGYILVENNTARSYQSSSRKQATNAEIKIWLLFRVSMQLPLYCALNREED